MIDDKKALGVLGGMGPMATQLFFKMVVEMTDAHSDQEHINMVILNHAGMPDRTEAILSGDTREVYEKLFQGATLLQRSGADYVAIPCNTSHYFIERLQRELPEMKFIDMIGETARRISEKTGAGKVGILATDGTVKTELYQKKCLERGLTPVVLSEESQKLVMKIIYRGVKEGGEIDFGDFSAIEKELSHKGCDCAIMGCTELSCFKESFELPDYYVDAMKILAEESILACGKKIKSREGRLVPK